MQLLAPAATAATDLAFEHALTRLAYCGVTPSGYVLVTDTEVSLYDGDPDDGGALTSGPYLLDYGAAPERVVLTTAATTPATIAAYVATRKSKTDASAYVCHDADGWTVLLIDEDETVAYTTDGFGQTVRIASADATASMIAAAGL